MSFPTQRDSMLVKYLRQRESDEASVCASFSAARSQSPYATASDCYRPRDLALPAIVSPGSQTSDDDRKLMLLFKMRKEQDSLIQQIKEVEEMIQMKERGLQLQSGGVSRPSRDVSSIIGDIHQTAARPTFQLQFLEKNTSVQRKGNVVDLTTRSSDELESQLAISEARRRHRRHSAVNPDVEVSHKQDCSQPSRGDLGSRPPLRIIKTSAPNFCVPVALPNDRKMLSKYQVLLRSSLEFCVASTDDTMTSQQGRRQRLRVGQVGVRCIHCSHMPPAFRSKGAANYPRSIGSLYQAAQNVATAHFLSPKHSCPHFPAALQKEMMEAKTQPATSLVGPPYWARQCRKLGMVEEDGSVWLAVDTATATTSSC